MVYTDKQNPVFTDVVFLKVFKTCLSITEEELHHITLQIDPPMAYNYAQLLSKISIFTIQMVMFLAVRVGEGVKLPQ